MGHKMGHEVLRWDRRHWEGTQDGARGIWMEYDTKRGHKVLGCDTRASGWDRSHQDRTEGTRNRWGPSGWDMRNRDGTGGRTGGAKRGQK